MTFLLFLGLVMSVTLKILTSIWWKNTTIIDLSLDELHYYSITISIDSGDGSCKTIKDPLGRLCLPTLRVLYFASINFRELKKFWFFASINFRELVIFRIFAKINFRGCRLLIKKNVILLTLQSTRNLLKWSIRAVKTHILTNSHFLTNN